MKDVETRKTTNRKPLEPLLAAMNADERGLGRTGGFGLFS
jgi:hypothetical protein